MEKQKKFSNEKHFYFENKQSFAIKFTGRAAKTRESIEGLYMLTERRQEQTVRLCV